MPDFQTGDRPIGSPTPVPTSTPMDWKSAIMELIAARAAIIRVELAEFRRQSARRAALTIMAVLAGVSTWLLLLVGGIPLLAQASGFSWPIMALMLAALHAVLFVVFILIARHGSGPAFSATLNEFQKDREWIENLTKTPKS